MTAPSSDTGSAAEAYIAWLRSRGHAAIAARVASYRRESPLGTELDLPGPVGERNTYTLRPRGRIAAAAATGQGALLQVGTILATGNTAVITGSVAPPTLFDDLPSELAAKIERADDLGESLDLRGVLHEGTRDDVLRLCRQVAGWRGPILPIRSMTTGELAGNDYDPLDLLEERSLSINTAAAGGNAGLLSLEA